MGIKKLIAVFIALVLFSSWAAGKERANQKINQARQKLKDYGLMACLIHIDADNALAKDLMRAKHSLSFAGLGSHGIVQDEVTLEVLNNPYTDTSAFIIQQAKRHIGTLKSGAKSLSHGCFKVYHSKQYRDFIAAQDALITS